MRPRPFLLLIAGFTLALMAGEADAEAIPVSSFDEFQPVTTTATGNFSPDPQNPGEAKILLVDDDIETWFSGPYVESTHIVTALNDGGYSYDIFRAGSWGGNNYELPSDDDGLSILDNYEVVIWYSGWNADIIRNAEKEIMEDYLDGACGLSDSFCTTNRNLLMLTQRTDYLNTDLLHDYLHTDDGSPEAGGTPNPIIGVDDSIFEGKSYSTNSVGFYYYNLPVAVKDYGGYSTGAFWMSEGSDYPYHAVQYPGVNYQGQETWDPERTYHYRSFMFSEEIGVFDSRTDRAEFFTTILEWMKVDAETTKNTDLGLSVLDIPRYSSDGLLIKNVPFEIGIGVTNYGHLDVGFVRAGLQLKNEFGLVLFNRVFDTRAFPEGHPMYLGELKSGETVIMTFNLTNDRYQLEYDGEYGDFARHPMFTTSGMHYLSANLDNNDQNLKNQMLRVRVGVAHAVETAEPGHYSTVYFGDTDDNGLSSYDGVNWHVTNNYDWDADGCDWARDCSGDQNHTGLSVSLSGWIGRGQYSFASFNPRGWYKTGANPSECNWDDFGDSDCLKFTPNPNQDDYIRFGPFDFSSMEDVAIMYHFTGCMESGDYHRFQISKDSGQSWTDLKNYSGFCSDLGAWYNWGGGSNKYRGYVLGEEWYGSSDTTNVFIRFQMDADSDQATESSSRPYPGWFIDDIVIKGTERSDKDIGISDISLRYGNFITSEKTSQLQIEVNVTVYNTGNYSYTDLYFCYTIFDDQGNELLDEPCRSNNYSAYSQYGDVTEAGHEDETDLFLIFEAPKVGIYTIVADIAVWTDVYPWNQTAKMKVELPDTFFSDNFDGDELAYTQYPSGSNEDNGFYWVQGDSTTGDARSGSTMFRYYEQGTNSYASGADDSTVTPDVCDRDGNASFFAEDICIDLIAGYEAALHYAIKWDLAAGDRLEVRISSDFNSSQRLGSWSVLKTYEGTSGDWSSSAWFLEEIDLSDFTREQVWIDFHMVSNNGGGKGVLLDSVDVKGKEYRNNLAIIDVTTDRFTMAGEEHDLSITIKSFGREPQEYVTVIAQITNADGVRVWPADNSFNHFSLPVALEKGETFTVNPTTAGPEWRWGTEWMIVSGIYTLHIEVWRDYEQQVPDEDGDDNVRNITLVLGANMLGSDEWSGDWSESDGAWSWDGSSSGTLTSDSFIVWNNRPLLVVEAEYDLIDANVKAQVRAGASGQWYDVEWRAVDQQSTLYSIPRADYSQPPDQWTGKSSFDKTSVQTFYADLRAVEQISDGSGNLQEQYIHNSMQIRLVGASDGGSGFFISHELLVMGIDDYRMDIISVTPSTWRWMENNEDVIDYNATINYAVTVRNLGAISDSGVVDFTITAPDNSFVTLESGSYCQGCPGAILSHIMQQGRETVVAIKPIPGFWGGNRDDPSGGDPTAYIDKDGKITWPSGTTDYTVPTGWSITNPTKANWDVVYGKPMKPNSDYFIEPRGTLTINLEITCRYSGWTPPGTYTLQADARSWTDYDNTFTSGSPDGQATIMIDYPDLYLGSISYDSEGYSVIRADSNGHYFIPEIWNADMEPYFTFDAEVLNNMPSPSNPTSGGSTAIVDLFGNFIVWTDSPVSHLILGMAGLEPAADGSVTIFSYYIAVDPYDSILESDENNNREEIQITITYDTAPIAYIDSNLTLNRTAKGDPYALAGSGVDIGGDITEYVWNSSIDGILGNEADVSISTLSLGVHEITLMVKDGVGLWSLPVYTTVWVYALPVATANHWNDEKSVKLDEAVHFRGTASDEDGRIVLYEWDFDGDGIYDWNGSYGNTSFSYIKTGRFEAVLRVTDNDGFVSTDVRDVHVSKLGIDPLRDSVSLVKDNLVYIILLFGLIGGFVYWKNRDYYAPISKTKPVTPPPPTRRAPMFSPSRPMVAIKCPGCSAQMKVRRLGKRQKVTCDSCGLSGEIEI